MDHTPRWIGDLKRLLPIRSQFVVAGNIRDSFLTPYEQGTTLAPLLRCLWAHLSQLDYRFLLVFDPVEGLRPYPNEPAIVEEATKLFDLKLADGVMPMSLENLIGVMRKVAGQREARCALVVDFASRLTRQPDHLDANEHRFFVAAERISLTAHPIVPKGADIATDNGKARFNPILWLVNRVQDLPSWLALDSTRVAVLNLGLPDYEIRREAAQHLGNLFAGYEEGADDARTRFAKDFAQLTDGLPLVALADIAQLADRQGIGFRDVDDAVQCFKVGATENPWKKDYLRERIADALPFIEERVRGQRPAVTKAIDILMRSVMGLTGAQARSSGNRPRGVLFFAGPTGVGKTELAKTLTQLIFGDERAYIRFDMSEFAEEHTGARLLGAPPGYIGYDAGGELTNAVREKPFSVVLFDEIEKAHPRILDKF
ncbi:MAG: AAA family ATPase, partial [Betaproteobacteria bacterium]